MTDTAKRVVFEIHFLELLKVLQPCKPVRKDHTAPDKVENVLQYFLSWGGHGDLNFRESVALIAIGFRESNLAIVEGCCCNRKGNATCKMKMRFDAIPGEKYPRL